jgi:hypothetical protein
MTGFGDRLEDVRQRPTFHLELASISYIPRVGPAAWAVYCYLVACASEGDARWPDDLTVATACGISTYNAQRSIETLIEFGLIARHIWVPERGGPTTFAVIPIDFAAAASEQTAVRQARGTDQLVAEDHAEEERWRREAEERNETRELFSRLLSALGIDPAELTEEDRSSVTRASRLARAAGATPSDIEQIVERLRQSQPDLVLDAERMLEYWSRLFRNEPNDEPNSPR